MASRRGKLRGMATRKTNNSGKKQTPKKKHPIHTAIEAEYGVALEAYRKSLRYYPDLKVVIEDALRMFLTHEGFHIPAQLDNSADND